MALVIKNLKKSFGRKLIFNDLSYNFADTGIYALVGESGIGKTTLLRIIAGLDKDYSGSIEGELKTVSIAFQEHRLFPQLTALDNLIFAISNGKSEAVKAKAQDMLRSLGFSDADMELYPDELSGGMKQRVSLARAFLCDAPILLLDEPTKELDEANAKRVKSIVKELSRDRLVLLVSHSAEDITDLQAEIIDLKCYK